MKRILTLLLPVAAALALMAPATAFAQQPTPTPKGGGKGGPPQGNGKQQFNQVQHTSQQQFTQKPVVTHTPPPKPTYTKPVVSNVNHTAIATPTPKFSGNGSGSGNPKYHKPTTGSTPPVVNKNIVNQTNATQNNNSNPGGSGPKYKKGNGGPQGPQGPQNPQVSQGNGPKGPPVAASGKPHPNVQNKSWSGPKGHGGGGGNTTNVTVYNRSNNYGGRWVGGNTYPDWNRSQVHIYNDHHYRWFNGGWLIIDGGFWPTGYYAYQTGGSKIYNAQAVLANMGYYNGTVDGIPGPMTRQAIADYQSDNNLPVDGYLNPPTQDSLGL